MIESNPTGFSCPLPENKAGEFFGVSSVSESILDIAQKFSKAVGRAATKVKSSEDLANLKDMIHRICDQNRSFREKYLTDLKLENDPKKSELPEIMAALITKAQEPVELANERAQEIQKDLQNFSENEKIILKNFTVRLTLNWLERIKERQQEIRQEEDLVDSFNMMAVEDVVAPSNSVKRARFGNEYVPDVFRLVDSGTEVQSQKKSRIGR
jgi:hypothetical protein